VQFSENGIMKCDIDKTYHIVLLKNILCRHSCEGRNLMCYLKRLRIGKAI